MNELIELIKAKILDYSGINIAVSQHQALITLIEKKASGRGMLPIDYVKSLLPHTPDFDEIINLITVNETYFFREELQFDFLKKEVFSKYMGKNLTIWTCCCSTGEEPISLLALALSMNVNLTIYASDIDDNALSVLSKGRYSTFSLRTDGQKYHNLLEPYSTRTETELLFRQDFLNRIHTFKFNLIKDGLSQLPFFENVDILFMRNVFIYFDKETRIAVTRKVTDRLKSNGLLFFSMNEIGSIDEKVIPKNFCKINNGAVYYFVKNDTAMNSMQLAAEANRRIAEKEKKRKNDTLQKEVQKVKIQKFSEQNEKLRKAKTALDALSTEKAFDAKQLYEDICLEINHGNFEKARTLVKAISGTDTKQYSYFMQGYIEYHADNRTDAALLFENAEAISPDFWPAFFYHGMILRDLGRIQPAKSCFEKCKKILSDFGNQNPYDFTLDSFSPSYISSLCETFSMGGGQ